MYNINLNEESHVIKNGTYSVSSSINGYNNSSIYPSEIVINDETDNITFTISGEGSINFNVKDDLDEVIVGATFYRCDSSGNIYGNIITSDSSGDCSLNYLPYGDGITIYYKQVSSDNLHEFDDGVKSINLSNISANVSVINNKAKSRIIKVNDSNYDGLNINYGELVIENVV